MLKDNHTVRYEGVKGTYEKSDIVIFGIPFDGTVSNRPGTRFGPDALRSEMNGLETYSPYQDKNLADYTFCDLDDIYINIGNTERTMENIKIETKALLDDNKKTVALGGEHLVSYPVIDAYIEKYPDLHVIHFDAHADLRLEFFGERLSHANVMRLVYEKLNSGKLWQFGIRSGIKEEFVFAEKNTRMCKFDLSKIGEAVKEIGKTPVYVSIDLDVLDPSIFCGTGTPEPGGVTFKELIDAMMQMSDLNIVGGDINELAPNYDPSGVSNVVGAKVLRELLLLMAG